MASSDGPASSASPNAVISLATLTQALQSVSQCSDVTVAGALLSAARADKLTFSGSDVEGSHSFDLFLVNYQALCNTYNSSKVARKIVLPNLLRGAAFSFYYGLEEAVKNDYDALCEALRAKFDSKEFAQRCLDRLSTIRQEGDSVAQYAQRVRGLGRSALGTDLAGPVYDTLLTQYFRNGLHPDIREKLEEQPVSLTFDDAVSMATRFQYNLMRRQNPDGISRAPVSQTAFGLRPVNRPNLSGRVFLNQFTRGQNRFPSTPRNSDSVAREPPTANVGRAFNGQRNDHQHGRRQRTEQPLVERSPSSAWCRMCRSRPCMCGAANHASNSPSDRSVVCYNCQKVGHFARDCRAARVSAPNPGNGYPSSRPVAALRSVALSSAAAAELEALRRDKADLSAQNIRLMRAVKEQMAPC